MEKIVASFQKQLSYLHIRKINFLQRSNISVSCEGMAADVGVLQRLPKIIGNDSLARELVYTGRKFSAKEAEICGFVSKVFSSKDQYVLELRLFE